MSWRMPIVKGSKRMPSDLNSCSSAVDASSKASTRGQGDWKACTQAQASWKATEMITYLKAKSMVLIRRPPLPQDGA